MYLLLVVVSSVVSTGVVDCVERLVSEVYGVGC